MANITTRSTSGTNATVKNSTLTNTEVDNNFINLNVDIQTRLLQYNDTSLYLGSTATSTRFPNAIASISNVAIANQKNESHNIGLISEGYANYVTKTIASGVYGQTTITLTDVTGLYLGQEVSATGVATNALITNINTSTKVVTLSLTNTGTPTGTAYIHSYGIGLYGVGYNYGGVDGVGVVGEAHVNTTGWSGNAIGVKGYSNDTHAGGLNIGLYGSAKNGASNYALWLSDGNIYSESITDKTWYLNSNLTFANVNGGSYKITLPKLSLVTNLEISEGGTGASDVAGIRANLGLVINSTIQEHSTKLDAIAALAVTDNNFIVGTGTTWQAQSGATARTSLGLGSIATQNSNAVSITGGNITNITSLTATTIALVNPVTVGDGGTGRTTIGTNGQVLTSNGASLVYITPSYVPTQTSYTGRYLKTNGTTASWDVLDIGTSDVTGTLPVTKGGTGLTSILDNGLIVGNGSNSIGTIAPGIAKRILRSDGTNWYSAPATGMVVQTVSNKVNTIASYGFAGYVAEGPPNGQYITALNTGIATTYTNSKILVQFNISFEVHHDTVFKLFRNTNNGGYLEIGFNTNNNSNYSAIWLPGYDADNASTPRTNHYMYLDSPGASANAFIAYALMIQSSGVGASTFYLNRSIGSTGYINYEVATSTVLLQEIY